MYEFKNNVKFLNFRKGNFKGVNAYFNGEGEKTVGLDTLLILALNVVHTVYSDCLFSFKFVNNESKNKLFKQMGKRLSMAYFS